eukprot:XP_011679450.1 PREDICTED: uncharacterized protein LOC588209 [Strongylocentrotus purpuratus]
MTSRKRKSLSSILKAQSPSRTALLDLNPNLNGPPSDETTHLDVTKKKQRRSSRRVSFAETYQVKEFMKDSDRKELGLWDDSQDGTTHQELPDLEKANNPSDHAGPSDSHLDAAHQITGLETLLSGPIKQEAHSMTLTGQDPYGASHTNVQSTSSAENFRQYPQSANLDQRKNDVNETSVKSSFLKSFIAADSCGSKGSFSTDLGAFAAPAFQSYPPNSEQQQQGGQEDPPQESSFRSRFLQAFVSAGPSSSSSEGVGSIKANIEQQNADPGMELTNCVYSSEVTNEYEGQEEKVGDITRIFGGQGDGFENGMDMTTCMGGFDTLQKKLDRPAAESTRIFNSENTDNMELTACLKDFGGTNTSRSLGRTLNQTGTNLNFTQVFGKMSESDYVDLPHESTARLLKRIDDAIAGSDCSGAETTGSYVDSSKTGNMKVLQCTRDNTRKSIVLDPIQEVSSSTASMLNVTSLEKSAVSAATPLDVCTEEDEMDITTCSNYTKDMRVRPVQQEQTRAPDNEDTTAMEMTSAIGNSLPAVRPSKVFSSSVAAKGSHGDHTRVFDPTADDSAEMEMTCAITQPLVTGFQAKDGLLRVPESFHEDKTRVFSTEDTAMMEMTCVVSGASNSAFSVQNVHRGKMMSSLSTRLPSAEKENALSGPSKEVSLSIHTKDDHTDHTRVFDPAADDSAEMEMTCAMDQPLVTGSHARGGLSRSPAALDEDKTRVFEPADDTAAMEMTCAINQPFVPDSHARGGLSRSPAALDEDKTRVFEPADDTAAMEMTCAINQPFVPDSRVKGASTAVPPSAFNESKTRISNSEDTAAMEMTCVLDRTNSSAFSFQNEHQIKMLSSVGLPSSEKEHALSVLSGFSQLVHNESTKHTEDTTRFETTTYLGKLPEGLAYQMRRKREKQGMDNLQTDGTAHITMTECVNAPPSTLYSENADLPQISQGNKNINGEKTCYFTADNGDDMHMTECLDKQPGGSQLMMVRQHDHELLQNEDTCNMEMTTCVGALQSGPSLENNARVSTDDQTHVFSEDTANMEMTCAGDVLPLLSKVKDTINKSSKNIPQSDDTTNMEMTACVGAFPSMTSNLDTSAHAGEPLTSDSLGKTIPYNKSTYGDTAKENHAQSDISAVTFPMIKGVQTNVPQSSSIAGGESESTRTHHTNLVTDGAALSNVEHPSRDEDDSMPQQKFQVLEEGTQQQNGEINISGDIPHDKTTDTYTLSHPALQQDEEHQLGEELAMQEKLLEGRNSDTFTVNASSLAGSGKRKLSSLTKANTTRTTSNSSEEGQAKTDGEGSSSSPDLESHASFVFKDSIILPDWIDAEDEKGILDELPIDNDNTEDLCLTSTKRPRIDEAAFTSSHMDASYLTSNLSHLPLSSESGASSVEDFLQMFFKFNDLPIGKRSIMCPSMINEPTTLSSQLENACLVKPKADMYEWAIKFLTPAVEELRKSVRSQETKHLKEGAPIIKEMQSAGPERCAEILKKGKSLQKYCTASSKAKMKEWRLQMINNTKAAMEDSSRHLENKLAKLTSSICTIDEQLQQLASVDSALDDAINSLEQIKLPTEEEKSEWVANSQRLESMETKLREEERTVQETERFVHF